MKDKEMIEEMAKDIETSNVYIDSNDITSDNGEYYCQWQLGCMDLANHLTSLNYRKLPEDSVVLSREEWKQIKNSLYYSKEALEKKLEKESKETAEKIFAELFDIASIHHSDIANILGWAKNKAKQFGVEIKEQV